MAKPIILVIGGLDPQGCAGITADIQAISVHQAHAVPLITAMTQQTQAGLTEFGAVETEQFMLQYQCCVADFAIDAIKVGLIFNIAIAQCIDDIIQKHDVPIVIDPVLATTSGGKSLDDELVRFIAQKLLPKATLVTPNLIELTRLTGESINDFEQVVSATEKLADSGVKTCLLKGGHADSEWAVDYFKQADINFFCYQQKFEKSVRGTGCVLASVIATQLAFGQDMRDAVVLAKAYLTQGIRNAEEVGPYRVFHHTMEQLQLADIPKLCYSADFIGKTFNFPECPQQLGIYPVVDSSDWIEKLVNENIKTIQLRIKDVSDDVKQHEIAKAVAHCDESVAFFVNDYWSQAIEANAYGVHLGQEDLHDAQLFEIEEAGLRLGVSTHTYWELARALAVNPSYIALGPIFETTSKQMPFSPQGIEKVRFWTQLLGEEYPLVAIGGIDQARAKLLKKTGVGSVAMISAITKASDYREATQTLIKIWQ